MIKILKSKIKNWLGLSQKIENRRVKWSRIAYMYFIWSCVAGLLYYIASFPLHLPWGYAFTPLSLIIITFGYQFLYQNWKMILLFREKNRLDVYWYMNRDQYGKEWLFWNDQFKKKVAAYIYPDKHTIRQETRGFIMNKVMNGEKLKRKEKRLLKRKTVMLPAQIKDGVNEMFLTQVCKYANRHISHLDSEFMRIRDLTDERLSSFDLQTEIDKLKTR